MAESVSAKAHRLYAEGRVQLVEAGTDGTRRYQVRGTSALYLVRWHPDGLTCTCPARGRCSHELAAILDWSAAHRQGNVVNPNGEENG